MVTICTGCLVLALVPALIAMFIVSVLWWLRGPRIVFREPVFGRVYVVKEDGSVEPLNVILTPPPPEIREKLKELVKREYLAEWRKRHTFKRSLLTYGIPTFITLFVAGYLFCVYRYSGYYCTPIP